MKDAALHNNHHAERGPFVPADDFERDHAAVIREKMTVGGLSRSQAILAVRHQINHDAARGTHPAGQSIKGNLSPEPFVAQDDFAVKHAAAIRERMRGGLTQAQALQCVRDQLAEDARHAQP